MLSFLFRSISLGLVSALIILVAFPQLRPNFVSEAASKQVSNIGSLQLSFNDAVRRAAPAVVNIYSRKYDESDRNKLLTQGLGSGVIVSEKGYIITNYHVV
ncbi:outer membrane-stress sensor serine endopeptidase DegS, partial [Vibrio fortis]